MGTMFEEEPEPIDEDSVEIQEELFETMKSMGTTPQDIAVADEARQYEDWLRMQAT
jgi:hypothetical protein